MPEISCHLLREIARRIRINGIVTREEAAMLESEYVMPSEEAFANSAEAKELLSRIHAVMSAGMDPDKGRTANSWRNINPLGTRQGHLIHAIHHLLNLHHHRTLDKIDNDTGLPELDHALTRVFFMAVQCMDRQKASLKAMEEAVAE
jgi:hypothetical protein